MSKSRTQRAIINTASLAFKEIIAFLCNFILPRLILAQYGSAYNGLITSITQFLNISSLLRLGIAGATRSSLYKALANNDEKGVSLVVNSAQNYLLRTGVVVGVYIILLSILYPFFFGNGISFIEIFIIVIACGSTTLSQYIFGLTYSSLLEADQKYYVVSIFETITNILTTTLCCILILTGFKFHFVKLICSLLWVLFPCFIYLFSKRKYKIDKKVGVDRTIIKNKNDAMAHSIANIFHENVDVIALTIFCGPAIVSVFAIYKLVTTGLKQVLSVFTGSLEAPFGEMWAKNEKENVKKNLFFYEFCICSFIAIFFSVALSLFVPFVALYTSNVTDVNYILPNYAFLVIISETIYCLRIPFQTLAQSAGHYKQTKKAAFFEAGLNVLVTFCLVWKFGLVGAVIGTMVANAFRTIYYCFYVSKNMIKHSFNQIANRLLWFLLIFILVYALSRQINCYKGIDGWKDWVVCGVIDVLISFTLYLVFSFAFYPHDLSRVFSIITSKTLWKRKRHEKTN